MKIVEKFIMGKTKNQLECEDGFFINEDFIVVIDGVTSQSDYKINDEKGGVFIKNTIQDIFLSINKDISCYGLFTKINQEIKKYYKNQGILDELEKNILYRPAASVIVYSKHYNEIWLIGDCLALYNNILLDNKLKIDDLCTDIRIKALEFFLETGFTEEQLLENDISIESTRYIRKYQQSRKNLDNGEKYSYAVIDGFNYDEKYIKIIRLDNTVNEIVLASDGYPKLFPTLTETEEYLNMILNKDPLCYKIFPFFKGLKKGNNSFDDRVYVRFTTN